ncbi:D-hexose-6-phosphate mutarotase [Vibrio sp. SM6]|uniref:Putative glucose-6-phosphate 1-epimerase n=1 Tax=Vibrio agarilyticus TaxID=2726741 RepID=A0A7X8YIL4_9VIBR|nr:D-hexose-6-phosphate mutarotase [Vibrio agarilyticus]NLS14527.1 D-hexose-6-phosphate mutarotase [Vibrio agarilyticus]
MDFTSYSTETVLSDAVTIINVGQNKVVRIQHELANAAISLFGGHILSYQPKGESDLIWMSEQAVFDNKTAIRGGIPICWPWFGRIAAPAHGFARTSQWALVEHRENEHGVIIELALAENDDTLAIWPHLFDLRLRVEIGRELTAVLNITNTDVAPWSFSGALHTYLNVGDITQATIRGMGPCYLDSLNSGALTHGDETLQLSDTIDRVYTLPDNLITLNDPSLDRQLCVRNQGNNTAVLWNPWSEGANAMSDMQNDGYQTMLCIESTWHAPSLEQGKTLSTGETHQLITRIGVA